MLVFIQTLSNKLGSIAGGGSFPEHSAPVQDVQRSNKKHQLALDHLEILTETGLFIPHSMFFDKGCAPKNQYWNARIISATA